MLALIMLLLGSATVAHAQPPAAASPLQACLAGDTPTAGGLDHVTGCYKAAYARDDQRLSAEYQALEGRLKDKHIPVASLSQGQAAWRAYRDQWCAFEGKGDVDLEARATTALMCKVEVTEAQLDRLEHAYQR
jgi:uncharacterized protein YecT (DUF1311 family)